MVEKLTSDLKLNDLCPLTSMYILSSDEGIKYEEVILSNPEYFKYSDGDIYVILATIAILWVATR